MSKADPARLGDKRRASIPASSLLGRGLATLRHRIDRTFAYREILLRSSDRVHCIRLTPRAQKGAALLLAAGVGWGLYASIGYVEQRGRLADRDQQIERSQAAYGELLAEVDRYQRHFASITDELEAAQRRLLAQLDAEAAAVPEGTVGQESVRARMVVAQDELRGQLEALEVDLKDVARRNGSLKQHVQSLQSALTATENERAEVAQAHRRLGRVLSETELALAHERSERADLAADLLERDQQVGDWKNRHAALVEAKQALAEERDLLEGDLKRQRLAKDELARQVAALEAGLADWKQRYAELAEARDRLVEDRKELTGDLAEQRAARTVLSQRVEALKGVLGEARAEVERVAGQRDALAADLKAARDGLRQALAARDGLQQRLSEEAELLAEAQDKIGALERRRAELRKGSDRLARALRDSKGENAVLADRLAELDEKLEAAGKRIAGLERQRDDHQEQIAELSADLDGSRLKVSALQGQLYGLTRTLDGSDRKAEALAEQRDVLRARLVEARSELAQQAARHDTVIRRLSDRTRQSIDTMEELLSLTGLDIEAVLDEASGKVDGDGKGGPFVPYVDAPDRPHADHPGATLGALDDRIRRWEALQLVLAATPLASPLGGLDFRISSYYGKRKDPLNGRLSRHEGLDMVAAYRSPVLATAPGTVVFAGWLSGYGRVVDVDHGFGITTRYAHLRRIDVEPGQRIGFREQIGQLGNSGRSTGAHVHYEVRYNDKPLDPLKFMKAANHVLKG